MTNVRFPSLADYRDIETTNFHREAVQTGLSLEEIMSAIYSKSRDNARTPMQWSGTSPHGGFTNGASHVTPWIGVNPNYTEINVEQALNDPDSIFYYYQKLIRLRREMPIIVRGKYQIFHEDHPQIYIYRRYDESSNEELFIACNFSQQTVQIDDPALAERLKNHKALLISNYEQNNKSNWLEFRPYEAWALQMS